jgi:hypothetical protein
MRKEADNEHASRREVRNEYLADAALLLVRAP